MTWRRFALVFLLCSSALSWGQPVPLPEPTLPPAPTEIPVPLSEQLRTISIRLEQANADMSADLESLSQAWTEASQALESARLQSIGLEADLQSMKISLDNLETSLQALTRSLARSRAELWLWRGGTALAILAAICFSIR